jgi:hypothetical protein
VAGEGEFHGPGPERERLPHPDKPELCDLCNALVTDGTERYAFVTDSSVIHPSDPALDGERLVVACCADHMRRLRVEAAARPYVEAELWARKLLRAMEDAKQAGRTRLSVEELRRASGLTNEQIRAAVEWMEREDHDDP